MGDTTLSRIGRVTQALAMTASAGGSQRANRGVAARSGRVWLVVAALLIVGGVVASGLTATSVAQHNTQRSRTAFEGSAVEVAATLRLAIQREEDLAVSATGYILGAPGASNAEFNAWATTVQAMGRYPELLGWGEVVIVEPARLEAFGAQATADPAGVTAGGSFALFPPGDRPFYCFFRVGQSRTPAAGVPSGFDYCSGDLGTVVMAARDSGHGGYQAVDAGTGKTLAVMVPFYAGGITPATVEARREAFVGWIGLGFDPKVLLDQALRDRPNTAVALRFQDASSDVAITSGIAPPNAESATIDLQNGWTVQTFGTVIDRGTFADRTALSVMLAGMLITLILAALLWVLGTGRALALRLVGERTGELRHQALHDALTGLPNRALIVDRIEQLLVRNRRHGTTGAALYIDLDNFKNVNDTLGHEAGDRLLVAVAARLTSALRNADTIGRMGGDEFVVLIDGEQLKVAPELVAERLLEVMRQPFELEGATMPIAVNTSIGIAIGDRPTGGELLRDADVALYEAKTAGKNRYVIFYPKMQTVISRRVALEFDLRSAVENEQLRLAYQPIYNLDDLSLVGVEALLRWDHPTLGVVEPDEFIPILEQTGQIQDVGRWVLRQACNQMAVWQGQGDTIQISVNVSGRQLDHDSIVDHVRDALDSSGLDARSLIIEVTETALMHNTAASARRLRAIKELGVTISVDDFGIGYSSLAYLQQFPFDCLKIDRSFTKAISTSNESKALIRTLVQLGKDLGLRTIAEGVETPVEMDYLRGERIDEVQGFLFSRPLDPETLERQILAPARPHAIQL